MSITCEAVRLTHQFDVPNWASYSNSTQDSQHNGIIVDQEKELHIHYLQGYQEHPGKQTDDRRGSRLGRVRNDLHSRLSIFEHRSAPERLVYACLCCYHRSKLQSFIMMRCGQEIACQACWSPQIIPRVLPRKCSTVLSINYLHKDAHRSSSYRHSVLHTRRPVNYFISLTTCAMLQKCGHFARLFLETIKFTT